MLIHDLVNSKPKECIVGNGKQAFGEAGACKELVEILVELSANEESMQRHATIVTKVTDDSDISGLLYIIA
jgi:hypothetical protein